MSWRLLAVIGNAGSAWSEVVFVDVVEVVIFGNLILFACFDWETIDLFKV
jgi:hypothetical protein